MTFANAYEQSISFRLTRLVRPLSGDGGMLALGENHPFAGAAVRLDLAGKVVWSRRYRLPGISVRMVDAAPAADGGFLLLAATGQPAPESRDDLLIRIDSAGVVKWARRLATQGYGGLRLVRAPGRAEGYVLLGRVPRTAERYRSALARLVRIDGRGAIADAVEISDEGGGRLLDIAALADGYVLVGDGGDRRPLAAWQTMARETDAIGSYGLLVDLDLNLRLRGAARLPAADRDGLSIRQVLAVGAQGLNVTGCVRGKKGIQVFAADLRRSHPPAVVEAVALNVIAEAERPVAADRVGSELAIVLHPDATGQNGQVTRLGPKLSPVGTHVVAVKLPAVIDDVRAAAAGAVDLALDFTPIPNAAIIAGLKPDFDCCILRNGERRSSEPLRLKPARAKAVVRTIKVDSGDEKVIGALAELTVKRLCGERLDWDGERMVQSPHLDLQASGSDGSDASLGVLLRWFLTGALDDHLAKGNYATAVHGFDKPDDHVALYRAEWPEPAPVRRLDLTVDRPVNVDDSRRTFFFETGPAGNRDRFSLRFDSAAGYAAAKQAGDPLQDPGGFAAAYGARPIEVELHGRLALACDLGFTSNPGGTVEIETLSAADTKQLTPRQVTSRRVLGAGDGPVKRLLAENLRGLRLRCSGARATSFAFIAYEDVLGRINEAASWVPLGRFALTLDDPTAMRRLEESGRFQVDGHWRKYHGGARVRVKNYADRWQMAGGLREGVQTYLQLSGSDPSATATVAGSAPGDGSISMSYLDMLQTVAIGDFHVARMLGQGFVDTDVQAGRRYVHLAAYVSLGDLGDGHGARPVQHVYMSLPTGLGDARLPIAPDLDGVHYGLSVPQGSGPPHQLTDAQGYTAEADARYIRLYPGCTRLYAQDIGFWLPSDLFDLSVSSLPTLYGIEYRGLGETGWRQPTIAHDPAFGDTQVPARPEVRATPFPAARYDRAFIHKETQSGVHEYAAYSINLFSRVSPLSAPVATDMTQFWRRNTLLPPSELTVQLIEPEAPLLLTTAWEQQALAAIPSGNDRTFVRLCCNYGATQDVAYGFADTIEILHRREVGRTIRGVLKAAVPDGTAGRLRIETKAFTYASTGETIAPDLPHALKPNFIGGALFVGAAQLAIEDVQWPGAGSADPIFIVRKPTTSGTLVSGQGQNTLVTQEVQLDIHPGDLVAAMENMTVAANWGGGNPLGTTIAIGEPGWTTQVETFTGSDGKPVTRVLRGIWDTATISLTNPGVAPGRYEIQFDDYILNPHPQSGDSDPVNWWRGTVRVPVGPGAGKEPRSLKVVEICSGTGGFLLLVALDEAGGPDPVLTGPGQTVNYYPGYQVHLHAHSDLANPPLGFDWPRLTPAAGEKSRTTLLAVRARDSSTLDSSSQPYRSVIGPPQLLIANEIQEPLAPNQPLGLLYATPPDTFNLSSYTFNVGFDHAPFSVAFYRAPALSILEALYHPEDTLPGVLAAIFPPDDWLANRFADLFAYMTDGRTGMSALPLQAGGTYAMPPPDHPDLALTGVLADDKARIAAAVYAAFAPLTAQPLIYEQISTDPAFVPSNRPQRLYDDKGNYLPPTQRDLSPMARRPASGHAVQFTDFTLDGSMNPDMVFFYYGREISEHMQMGPHGTISAPVKLVNFAPPAAPQLHRMTIVPDDVASATGPSIRFELVEPSQVDPIARLRIYRATDPALALSLRTMDLAADFDLAALPRSADGYVVATDDFAGGLGPYGDPLSYRFAWAREVGYEDPAGNPKLAQVPSEPTRTFVATLIDVINPLPPVPVVTLAPANAPEERMVTLTWSPTRYNATYYVTRLSESGVWIRLGEVRTNQATASFALADPLPVLDEDAAPIFYRFSIDVIGSSGLLNLVRAPVTVRLDQL
jgi:hypothetical protein